MAKQPSRRRNTSRHARPAANGAAPTVITEAAVLAEACAHIRDVGTFAFDTEFVMEDRFAPEVCVIQMATDDHVYVVDPCEIEDLMPIWALVADPNIEVVVHAGMEDLALCQTQGGVTPQRVFDCQVACGLVTTFYPLSLARMVRHLLGVRLHKSQTLTDWRRRPLSDDQVHYAAEDVCYLPATRRNLASRLASLGRESWVTEEMARFSDPATYTRTTSESVRRIKGAGSLDGLGLAIVEGLLGVREQLATKFNRPARAVIRDHLLIEIAKHRWTDAQEIGKLRGLNLRASAQQDLARAVETACALPKERWPVPTPPDDESDQEAAIAMLLGAMIRAFGAEHKVAHQLIATKKDIRAYVRRFVGGESFDDGLALEIGWRADHVGVLLQALFRGELRVGVDGDGADMRVVTG